MVMMTITIRVIVLVIMDSATRYSCKLAGLVDRKHLETVIFRRPKQPPARSAPKSLQLLHWVAVKGLKLSYHNGYI